MSTSYNPTPLKHLALIPPKAPNLPIGPTQYDQRYQDQVLNAENSPEVQADVDEAEANSDSMANE